MKVRSAFDFPKDSDTGIENIGEGWHGIVGRLEKDIKSMGSEIDLQKIYSDNGFLQYIAEFEGEGNPYARVQAAQRESATVCEKCGLPGERQYTPDGNNVVTWCANHALNQKRLYEREHAH